MDEFKPDYYCSGRADLIAFALQSDMGAIAFTITKYLIRAGKKPGEPALKDLRKAQEYLTRWIEFEELKDNG